MPVFAPKKSVSETHEHVVCRAPFGTKALLEDYRRINGLRSKNEAINQILHEALLELVL